MYCITKISFTYVVSHHISFTNVTGNNLPFAPYKFAKIFVVIFIKNKLGNLKKFLQHEIDRHNHREEYERIRLENIEEFDL